MNNLKAYHCKTDWDDDHEIYFFKTNIEARKLYSQNHCDGEMSGISVTRMPWADKYSSTGIIPKSELVDAGWRVDCWGCSRTISEGEFDEVGYYIEDLEKSGLSKQEYMDKNKICESNLNPYNMIDRNNAIYCNQECMDYSDKKKELETLIGNQAYKWMKFNLLKKVPEAIIKPYSTNFNSGFHCYVMVSGISGSDYSFKIKECSLQFRTEVTKYNLSFEIRGENGKDPDYLDPPQLMVANGDKDVFEKWISDKREKKNE